MFFPCRLFGIGVLAALLFALRAAADDKSAEETLKGKGLRRTATSFVLPGEAEVAKRLRDADALKKKIGAAQRELGFWQQKVEEKQNMKLMALQRRRELSAQLPLARSVDAHNRIVAAISELSDRVALLEQSKQEEAALKAAQGTANQVGEQFVEQILQARKLCDKLDADYKALQADAQVSKAIEEYNQATGKTYRLGPSPSLVANQRKLEKLEETVLSDSIDLRQGPNRLWQVSVVLNGQAPVEMAIDTGASVVLLPWKMAQAVGLIPKPQDPKINLQTADGTVIEGHRVVAGTVRVGKFTAQQVECAVLPEKMLNAAPLLGLSFFKHFSYKIDTANSKLIMSQVEADQDAAGAKPEEAGQTGPVGDRYYCSAKLKLTGGWAGSCTASPRRRQYNCRPNEGKTLPLRLLLRGLGLRLRRLGVRLHRVLVFLRCLFPLGEQPAVTLQFACHGQLAREALRFARVGVQVEEHLRLLRTGKDHVLVRLGPHHEAPLTPAPGHFRDDEVVTWLTRVSRSPNGDSRRASRGAAAPRRNRRSWAKRRASRPGARGRSALPA